MARTDQVPGLKFWKKVNTDGPLPEDAPELGPCWMFGGYTTKQGYGMTSYLDHTRRAHLLSYELITGPIPDGLTLDHICHGPSCVGGPTCHHRRCVNPHHLTPKTIAENLKGSKSQSTINAAKTHCVNGHEFTPENTLKVYPRGIESRGCRICRNTRSRERSARLRAEQRS